MSKVFVAGESYECDLLLGLLNTIATHEHSVHAFGSRVFLLGTALTIKLCIAPELRLHVGSKMRYINM